MSLIAMILAIAVIGLIVWAILQIPMPAPFQKLIIAVAVLVMIVWLLQCFGLVGSVMVPRIK